LPTCANVTEMSDGKTRKKT